VADEDDRAILRIEHSVGGGDIVGKRGQWVLDGSDGVALSRENASDAILASLIDEGAMHEDDVLDGTRRQGGLGECRGNAEDSGGEHEGGEEKGFHSEAPFAAPWRG
jgi:hypothetical protein